MNNIFGYKIDHSQLIPYQIAINEKAMSAIESYNEIVASSRIYFICKIRKEGVLSSFFSSSTKYPEVLYVGETFDKSKRYKGHEHLLRATTLVNNYDSLYVYFIKSRFTFAGFPIWKNSPMDVMLDLKDLNSKASVRLLERMYIYLFQPRLNSEKEKGLNISKYKLIKEKLLENQIRYLHLDIGMNEQEYQFWSPQSKSKSDWSYLDLENDEVKDGMPDLFS